MSSKIIVIRMRGEVSKRKEILDTFRMLGLKKLYSAKLLENTPSNMGMVKKVENFAAWGEAAEETEKLLESRIKGGASFGLKPPRGGLKSKKLRYPRGNLGYCEEKINELVKRMV